MPYSNTTPPSYSLSFLASQAGVFQQDLATDAWKSTCHGIQVPRSHRLGSAHVAISTSHKQREMCGQRSLQGSLSTTELLKG